MGIKKNITRISLFVFLIVIIFSIYNNIYAADDYYKNLLSDGESCIISNTQYVTKYSNGVQKYNLDELLDKIRLEKYRRFVKSFGEVSSPFDNTSDVLPEKYSGGGLDGVSIYSDGLRQLALVKSKETEENSFKITADGKDYTFIVPAPYVYTILEGDTEESLVGKFSLDDETYLNDWDVFAATHTFLSDVEIYVKQGLLAGNVEKGYNVGSVYSIDQKPLADVMQETSEMPTSSDTDSTNTSTNTKTGFFKFNSNQSLRASLDYFYSPLFGRMDVGEELPREAKDWNKTKYYSMIDITDGKIEINDEYKLFVNPNSALRVGLYEVTPKLDFTNGVKIYSTGSIIKTVTNEPTKLLDYTMRIAVPKTFTPSGLNEAYGLADSGEGLAILDEYRMSLYDDTIYKEDETKSRTKVCTNADLDLERAHLALFHHVIVDETESETTTDSETTSDSDDDKVGVVIVLKYSEVVVDTSENTSVGSNSKIYYTGRDIILNNNYSSSLRLDKENKEVMSYRTKITNARAIAPINFAFPIESESTLDYLTKRDNHIAMEKGNEFSFLINFVGDTAQDEVETKGGTPYGFVIFRNNSFVEDTELLNWLTTDEAKGNAIVKTNELRALIKGEFGVRELGFSEWLEMQRIKSELNYYKDNMLFRVINVLMILIGSFLIILGMLFILAYWFDIFNTFTDLSILYLVSGRNLYPVSSDDMSEFIGAEKGNTKYVTFKDVVKISIVCWFFGMIFFNGSKLMGLFVNIYMYLSSMIG